MKRVRLFKDGQEMLGSDGRLYLDGRLNLNSITQKVLEVREERIKNNWGSIPDAFALYIGNNTSNGYGKIHKII